MPVDRLKLDRSFVRDLSGRDSDQGLAKAIIAMGHSISVAVIAEGVETAMQAEILKLDHRTACHSRL